MKKDTFKTCPSLLKPIAERTFSFKMVKNGFTLAEVISVVIVLGIVAAIIIPSAIRRHIEIVKRTKIKKALASYETLIQKMIIENDLRSETALNDWAAGPNGTCANARKYFKIAEDSQNPANPCLFKTTDGLWWWIDSGNYTLPEGGKVASISRTIVSFDLLTAADKKYALNDNRDQVLYKKAANDDWKETFFFVTSFDDNGSPRIMDLSYGLNNFDWSQIRPSIKVYSFINKKTFEDYMPTSDDCNGTEGHRNCCRIRRNIGDMFCYDNTGVGVQSVIKCNNGNLYSYTEKNGIIQDGHVAMCGFRYYGVPLRASQMCKDDKDTSGFCYIYKTAQSSIDINDFGLSYSPRCNNYLGDGCIRGTVFITLKESCLNDSACVGKYKPDSNIEALLPSGVSSNQYSSFEIQGFECTENIQNNTCAGGSDTYMYQKIQKIWRYKDSNGNTIASVYQRKDVYNGGKTVYYIEKSGKLPRRCPSGTADYNSCTCCKYDAPGECHTTACD